MSHRITLIWLGTLGLLLPWHGALTVFGPDWVRWWKEVVLFLLLGFVILNLVQNLRDQSTNRGKWLIVNSECFLRQFLSPIFYAVLFLVWGGILVLTNQDLHTALVAFRYLALGVFAMLLGYGLWKTGLNTGKNGYTRGVNLFHIFCTWLTIGVLSSTLFGLWAKLFGGYQVLSGWYSNTISSWVPGQTVPLYHQVGDFVRLQGGSSGPVEYAHLTVLAVWYVLFFAKTENFKFQISNFKLINGLLPTTYYLLLAVLLLGIYHSGSRAALLGVGLLLLCKAYQVWLQPYWARVRWTADKWAAVLLVAIAATAMLKFTFSKAVAGEIEFMNKNIVRLSDSEHLSRPLEAWRMTLQSPVSGNLGQLGPAARAKNLREHNNDQAPIAESVPLDISAQLGFLGLFLWLGMWLTYWRWASFRLRVLLFTFVPLLLLATLFDMAPLSISFYLVLGLGLVLPQVRLATIADHPTVFELKALAFRRYVEQVWGWQDREQQGFVRQELEQGTVQLVELEGVPRATFSLVSEPHGEQLYSFYVHPAHQNQGLGTYLLTGEAPAKALYLQVLKVNSGAKDFYQRHDFVVINEDEHHYNLQRTIRLSDE